MGKKELTNHDNDARPVNEVGRGDAMKALLLPLFETYADRLQFAYLFGSAAQEEASPISDIDIAVFLSQGPRAALHDIRLSLYTDLCKTLKRNELPCFAMKY